MPVTTSVPDYLQPNSTVPKEESEEFIRQINEFMGRGRPSSWSAAVDKISSGAEDEQRRLIVLAAGNTEPTFRVYYPNNNLTEGIHDPAQSWNALTVGAATEKCEIDVSAYPRWQVVAPSGGLCPASTTSVTWQDQWPLKPDICMEGGNMAIDPATQQPDYMDSLELLTTNWDLTRRLLTTTRETSAAATLTARMAAIIQAEYPQLWPETIRALIVHFAEWAHAMWTGGQFSRPSRTELRRMLRSYGYGVPNLDRAL